MNFKQQPQARTMLKKQTSEGGNPTNHAAHVSFPFPWHPKKNWVPREVIITMSHIEW